MRGCEGHNRWMRDGARWELAERGSVWGARTLAFAASASFTIVFIFMDASAAILRAATRPPRAADECLGHVWLFPYIIISEVPKVILSGTPPPTL